MNEPPTWSKDDLEETRLLRRKLSEVLRADPFTEASMQTVTRLCDRAMLMVDDEYCQEMFCHVDLQAHRLLKTGARHRHLIRMSLDAIDQRLGSLETLRRTGNTVARAQATLSKS